MRVSVILASRSRADLLTNLLQSIKDTTHDISQVEVLIGIDNDDDYYQQITPELHNMFPFAHLKSRDRSPWLNHDYLNWLSTDHSKGKYIILCNDDVMFRTKDWDIHIERRMEEYLADKKDRVAYAYMSDALINRNGMNYCCFPLITREAMECLGFAMPPEYRAWNADIALWRIFSSIDRICDISEVMIEHVSYHSGKRQPDHINEHVRNISNGMAGVNHHLEKLKENMAKRNA